MKIQSKNRFDAQSCQFHKRDWCEDSAVWHDGVYAKVSDTLLEDLVKYDIRTLYHTDCI